MTDKGNCPSLVASLFVLLLVSSTALSSEEGITDRFAANVFNSYLVEKTGLKTRPHTKCDLALSFLPAPVRDGLVFTNQGLLTIIRIMATNVGTEVCPRQFLKLLRYRGRQGWVERNVIALPSLAPGGERQLRWWVNPRQIGYYTYKPQFVGGLIDADVSNHAPAKKFQAIFRTHD